MPDNLPLLELVHASAALKERAVPWKPRRGAFLGKTRRRTNTSQLIALPVTGRPDLLLRHPKPRGITRGEGCSSESTRPQCMEGKAPEAQHGQLLGLRVLLRRRIPGLPSGEPSFHTSTKYTSSTGWFSSSQ